MAFLSSALLLLIMVSNLFDCSLSAGGDNIAELLGRKLCDSSAASEKDLRLYLWQNYFVEDRPRKVPSAVVNVSFGLVIESVKEVRLKEREIAIQGYLYVNWYDDYLVWKGLPQFECVSLLVIPASNVWLPDIALMKAPHKYTLFNTEGEKVRIYNDGFVHFRPGGLFSAGCEWDLSYFPYDEQTCTLSFQSWLYLNSYMAIKLESVPISYANFEENDEWELVSHSSKTQIVHYSNKAHPYDSVKFTLNLRRRVGFFIMNVIIPATIISLVEASTWMLPSDEAVKLHISFTCLLAFGVFQLMTVPELPMSSIHTPLLSIYICLEMAYIGLAIFGQGFVFLLLHHSDRKTVVPDLLVKFCRKVAIVLFVPFPELKKSEDILDESDYSKLSFQDTEKRKMVARTGIDKFAFLKLYENASGVPELARQQNEERKNDSFVSKNNKLMWNYVISVIDRFMLVLYICCVIATPIILFLVIPGIALGMVRTLL